jgi:hypothetical protein
LSHASDSLAKAKATSFNENWLWEIESRYGPPDWFGRGKAYV